MVLLIEITRNHRQRPCTAVQHASSRHSVPRRRCAERRPS
jgi:hypothetical protein